MGLTTLSYTRWLTDAAADYGTGLTALLSGLWGYSTLGQLLKVPPEPRFSQWVGLVISVIGVIGYATGLTLLGIVAAALALAAAFLNAAFGLCLGCEMYVMIRRFWPASHDTGQPEHDKEVPA